MPDTDASGGDTPDRDDRVSIAITPMHRSEEGIWESGGREGAVFFLVELVQADGEEAEILLECRNERAAAMAARIAAATIAALGLASEEEGVAAFDEDTARILMENPTPEIAPASGEWRDPDETPPPRPS